MDNNDEKEISFRKPRRRFKKEKVCDIHFRCTEKEKQKIEELSERLKWNKSKVMCKLINDVVIKELPPIDYIYLRNEWRKVGTNLNQIAAKLNSSGFTDNESLKDEIKKINDLIKITTKEFGI